MFYAVSDLHGCFDMWKHLLSEINFKMSDNMYVLGDVIDYGDEPMELLLDMMERVNVYPIIGEREYKFLRFIKNFPVKAPMESFATTLPKELVPEFTEWIKNGGRTTFEGYMKLSPSNRHAVLEYLDEFMLYDQVSVEDDRFMFFHSGIKDYAEKTSPDDYDIESFITDSPVKPKSYFRDCYTVVGHTPTFSLPGAEKGKIYTAGGFIDIDCGCYFRQSGGRLGCLRLDDFKEIYV